MSYETILKKQQSFFKAGHTQSYDFRMEQLKKLRTMLHKYEAEIHQALYDDLGKSDYEILLTELGVLYQEIDLTMKQLRKWMKPESVKTPLTHKGAKSFVYKQPYGAVLIISPWNYPLNLSIMPLIGALAAGNTAVIKPSEFTPSTSHVIETMIKETFDEEIVKVIQGDKDVANSLLDLPFDYIFFTGSTRIGKIVMEKASQHLTPVTLELGGKSPAIVDEDAKVSLAAKRIAWGKLLNAGQTCIAPDYVLVHENIKDEFVTEWIRAAKDFFNENPIENENYTKIIHDEHFDRLRSLAQDENILYGGEFDEGSRKMNPILIDEPGWERPVMQEEIFGPILPIRSFQSLEDVPNEIGHAKNPLALYYFGESKEKQDWLLSQVSFGGGAINDTIMHIGTPHLPFGGIGSSGIGRYHGKHSFDTFTHQKSVLKQTTSFDISIRYPNAKNGKKILSKLFKRK